MRKRFSSIIICSVMLLSIVLNSCKDDTVDPIFTGSINGKIFDDNTHNPLANVSVTTSPASSAVVTDASGSFTLTNLTVGSYSITATKSGYKKIATNVAVNKDGVTPAIIYMQAGNDNIITPSVPVYKSPANQAANLSTNLQLTWNRTNNIADSIKFSVYLMQTDQSTKTLIAENIKDTTLQLSDLNYNSTYFWQVVAKSQSGIVSNGVVWSFNTRSFPDNPFYYISNSTGHYEIYSTDGTAANTVKITNYPYSIFYPKVNRQLNLVAFSSMEDLNLNIYTVTTQGKNLSKITQIPLSGYNNNGTGFDWSPYGGLYLIYPSNDKLIKLFYTGGLGEVIAMAPANRHFREAHWNSTGDKIIALTMGQNFYDSEIYIVNADGSGMQLAIDNLPGAVGSPSFSPNGKSIMYTNDADGFQDITNRQTNTHIYIKDLTTGAITDVSKNKANGTNDLEPQFSPDGSQIIFTNCRNDGTQNSIWTMDISGDNRTKIADNARMPDWK